MSFDIGTITGIIGSITGIAGSVMGFIAFRHSKQLKTADRRIELAKLRNAAHQSSVALTDLMPLALKSRERILAAKGKSRSGDMVAFKEAYETDYMFSSELAQKVPSTNHDFKSLSRAQIEERLIELDRTKGWIDKLLQKYEASMREDKEDSNELVRQRESR